MISALNGTPLGELVITQSGNTVTFKLTSYQLTDPGTSNQYTPTWGRFYFQYDATNGPDILNSTVTVNGLSGASANRVFKITDSDNQADNFGLDFLDYCVAIGKNDAYGCQWNPKNPLEITMTLSNISSGYFGPNYGAHAQSLYNADWNNNGEISDSARAGDHRVPEPSFLVLLGLGMASLAFVRKRI